MRLHVVTSCRLLAGRTSDAVGAVVVTVSASLEVRRVGLVVSSPNDLVDLAAGVLVVEIVDLSLAVAGVGEVALAVHVAGVATCHRDLLGSELYGRRYSKQGL